MWSSRTGNFRKFCHLCVLDNLADVVDLGDVVRICFKTRDNILLIEIMSTTQTYRSASMIASRRETQGLTHIYDIALLHAIPLFVGGDLGGPGHGDGGPDMHCSPLATRWSSPRGWGMGSVMPRTICAGIAFSLPTNPVQFWLCVLVGSALLEQVALLPRSLLHFFVYGKTLVFRVSK